MHGFSIFYTIFYENNILHAIYIIVIGSPLEFPQYIQWPIATVVCHKKKLITSFKLSEMEYLGLLSGLTIGEENSILLLCRLFVFLSGWNAIYLYIDRQYWFAWPWI